MRSESVIRDAPDSCQLTGNHICCTVRKRAVYTVCIGEKAAMRKCIKMPPNPETSKEEAVP